MCVCIFLLRLNLVVMIWHLTSLRCFYINQIILISDYVAWPQVDRLEEGPHLSAARQRRPPTMSQVRLVARVLYLHATVVLPVFVRLGRV